MWKATMVAMLVLAVDLTACRKSEPPRRSDDSAKAALGDAAATAPSEGSGSERGPGARAAEPEASGTSGPADEPTAPRAEVSMAHSAGNCPSTVLGSTTSAVVKAKSVIVTIRANDKSAIASIQKRADEIVKLRQGGTAGDTHDRRGTYGGRVGLCPILTPDGGKVTIQREKQGVAVTMTPVDKLDELKAEVDRRIAKADEWMKGIEAADKVNSGPRDHGHGRGTGGGTGDGTGGGNH